MLLALAALLLATAVFLAGEVVTQPARERRRSVRRAATYGRVRIAAAGSSGALPRACWSRLPLRSRASLRLTPAGQHRSTAALGWSPPG